ncbi:MAG: quinoprotein dehydrogenase-associated putative ABC transporter substrate-binding protein [Hyphomicrobiales bacterium]|nr:quinoprotein dehydrogenase-associated putative ABC transporter substrate-binding protein [Hyphomicrobiales bacterium]
MPMKYIPALALMLCAYGASRAQQTNPAVELVDPRVLRVCADPSDLPLSNDKGEGYENKIAALLATSLHKRLAYTYYPASTGFLRNTLMKFRCDLVMGEPQGVGSVQATNPYFATAYALVFKPGTGLDGITTLEDPRLKSKRIGLIAGTPPATNIEADHLMGHVRSYPLVVDTRFHLSTVHMIKDIESGKIDVGVLWGPMAGYFAKESKPPLRVVPLVHEKSGPAMAYRMVMGVRPSDQDWKRQLNGVIAAHQAEITQILKSYGVPLLDANFQPIKP